MPRAGSGVSISLVSSLVIRSADTISRRFRPGRSLRRATSSATVNPSLAANPGRAQDAQAGRRRTTAPAGPRCPQHLPPRAPRKAAERVGEVVPGQPGPPSALTVKSRRAPGLPLARCRTARPGLREVRSYCSPAVGGDLEDRCCPCAARRWPKRESPDPPQVRSAQPLAIGQHLIGGRVRGEIEVARLLAEQDIPDRNRRPARVRGRGARTGGRSRPLSGIRSRQAARRSLSAVRCSWATAIEK